MPYMIAVSLEMSDEPNIRFRNAKRTVRTAETYSSKEETIQTTITFNKKTL